MPGHDIETPAQLCEAILSSGEVQFVIQCLPGPLQYRWRGALSYIEISKEGIRAWRAYGVGPGRPPAEI